MTWFLLGARGARQAQQRLLCTGSEQRDAYSPDGRGVSQLQVLPGCYVRYPAAQPAL